MHHHATQAGFVGQPALVREPAIHYPTQNVDALTLQTIAEYAGGVLRCGDPTKRIKEIGSDSRAVGRDTLFLALRGDRFDGHEFVAAVAAAGAAGAMIEAGKVDASLPTHFALIEVRNSLLAYQRLAAAYRRTLPCKLVAITGSNGKTSTKDLTAAVLASRFKVVKTHGNLNNHIGVPRTLLQISAQDEVAVVEMGMNHPGEIAPLASLAAPNVAVITNIGTAHIEYMQTQAAIALEKGRLAEAVDSTGHVVLPAEDPFSESIAERTAARVVTVGFQRGDIRAEDVRPDANGTLFTLVSGGERLPARLPVPGKHMVLNSLFAVAVGSLHGVSLRESLASLAEVSLTKGRLELKTVAGLKFLDDSYNANPDSMVAALETLARMPVAGRRIAILGRMGELGSEAVPGNQRVGAAAAREQIDQVVAIGQDAEHLVQSAKAQGLQDATAMESVEEAASWLSDFAQPDDLILIKGSRSAGLERVFTHLVQQRSATAT